MQAFAGLSVVALILVALAVVIKTLALWRRTRGLPELLLSLYLTCATIIGYPLAIGMAVVPAAENRPLHIVAVVIMCSGTAALVFFTFNVFRRESRWARWGVGLLLACLALGVAAYIREVMSAHPRSPQEMPVFTAVFSIPGAVAYFWTTFEAMAYRRQLARRLELGLAEPMVVNRVLLWALMALAAGLAVVLNSGGVLLGSYMSAPVVGISSLLGLGHASCLFLAFHPPGWYARWVEGGAAEPAPAA